MFWTALRLHVGVDSVAITATWAVAHTPETNGVIMLPLQSHVKRNSRRAWRAADKQARVIRNVTDLT